MYHYYNYNYILKLIKCFLQVCELSRLVRSTIQSTTRAILRYLFDDSFLQNYSYKGQKQKKVFSTLAICSVIFGMYVCYYCKVNP